jgi:hypothetical protein
MAVAPEVLVGEAVEATKAFVGTAAGIAVGTAAAGAAKAAAVGASRECTEEVRMESWAMSAD